MIDNPGEEKKDDGNYYAEHIYASPWVSHLLLSAVLENLPRRIIHSR